MNPKAKKLIKRALLKTSPTFVKVQNLEAALKDQKNILQEQDRTIELLFKYIMDLHHGMELKIDNLDDYLAINRRYHERFGTYPNLHDPRKFSEKIQWRKLFDRKVIYTQCADKYKVREYVSERIDKEHLIPLLQTCESPEEIDYSSLPHSFVIKTNHASRTNILVENSSKIDKEEIVEKLRSWLKINFYRELPEGQPNQGREWQYRDIKPLIMIEEMLRDNDGGTPNDYKFHCFRNNSDSEVLIQLDLDRFTKHKRNIYDESWNKLPFTYAYEQSEHDVAKPLALDKMVEIAKCLSEDFDYVRVDLYLVKGQIFFGELTFTPENGFGKFIPAEFDTAIGEKWQLAK